MSEELKRTLKYLKNKNNTRRIKAISITEAQKVVEEIERLNNIINELEKYLKKVIETSSEQERITCSFVLQYLQELKGSDKE